MSQRHERVVVGQRRRDCVQARLRDAVVRDVQRAQRPVAAQHGGQRSGLPHPRSDCRARRPLPSRGSSRGRQSAGPRCSSALAQARPPRRGPTDWTTGRDAAASSCSPGPPRAVPHLRPPEPVARDVQRLEAIIGREPIREPPRGVDPQTVGAQIEVAQASVVGQRIDQRRGACIEQPGVDEGRACAADRCAAEVSRARARHPARADCA